MFFFVNLHCGYPFFMIIKQPPTACSGCTQMLTKKERFQNIFLYYSVNVLNSSESIWEFQLILTYFQVNSGQQEKYFNR